MIRSIELQNFKSLTCKTPLKLEKLSILCGSNSSGKSSIIQAILMLTQTLSSRYFKSAISLNGHLVRLGSFSDIIDHTSQESTIRLKVELEFTQHRHWIHQITHSSLDYTFGAKDDQHRGFESQFHPHIIKGCVALTKIDSAEEYIVFESDDNPKFADKLYKVTDIKTETLETLHKEYPDFNVEGSNKLEILPSLIQINYDHTKKISQQLVPFLIGSPIYLKQIKGVDASDLSTIILPRAFLNKVRSLIEKEIADTAINFVIPEEILGFIETEKLKTLNMAKVREILVKQSLNLTPDFIPDDLPSTITMNEWRDLVSALDEKGTKSLGDFLLRNRDTIQGVWYANTKRARKHTSIFLESFQSLDHYLSTTFERSIKYLGPLRNEPQAIYQAFDLAESTKVGLKGEYTAAVLHINRGRRIIAPAITELENGRISFQQKQQTLEEACIAWLKYLGVVTAVKTSDKGKLGYELQVKTSSDDKNWQDLTHVGVGVSQILPIVVMALLATNDEVLIFEQPELHLHPKVQSRLCDFFIAITNTNIQCIIETHSEYMINRLRLRIAESRDNAISDRSTIVFIEKDNGRSSLRKVDITQFGSIIDWPKDFFDQTDIEIENILLEATKKKRELSQLPKEKQ
ncbi:DUF3696 domain-containing protein [Pseudomonas umsongensis]|uniref:DUF3696 domain-containing protein n=1 Tax=Pseudomonas umsongensis TaxID=198618 RepID=UPI00200B9BB8|nr:DUF3696 domain-containing protein [Pseudomonas umsongensis]MCK8655462.1 DUF3696 domain-containing protein [Pseudomonas umsongensis]